jgi:hypothetical protein
MWISKAALLASWSIADNVRFFPARNDWISPIIRMAFPGVMTSIYYIGVAYGYYAPGHVGEALRHHIAGSTFFRGLRRF